MWSSWPLGIVGSIRCLVDSWDSTIPACFVFDILSGTRSLASISWSTNDLDCSFCTAWLLPSGFPTFSPHFLWFLDILCLPDQLSKFLSVCAHSQALALRLPILALLVFALLYWDWSILLATCDPFSQSFELLKVSPLDRTGPRGGFSFNNENFLNQVQKSDNFLFSSTVHKSSMRFSCMTSRFVWVDIVTSKKLFQWNTECFFLRHVELNSRFSMMTINGVTLNWPKVIPGFSVIFWFCWSRLFRFALKSSTEIFTPHSMFSPKSGFSDFIVSSKQFRCTICKWGN